MAHDTGELPELPPPVVLPGPLLAPEVRKLRSSLRGWTWSEQHWPAARRREAQAIERFQHSKHALWSDYERARLAAGRHERVQAETHEELAARARALEEQNALYES